MKVAEAIIQCLNAENITTIFGYPGAAVLPLYEELRKSDIEHILVRHEQAAGHAASGYARATGTTGVCLVTSGPGVTNLITSIATAYMDSIPMVIISGQVRSDQLGKDVFQEVDTIGATEPFTKHNYLVKDGKEICKIIKEAFYIASTGRPGPVLIDIPTDILTDEIEFSYPENVNIRGYKPKFTGHRFQIKKAIERIKNSKRPLICAGGGVTASKAVDELRVFVEKSNIPFVHTLMGKECLEASNPFYVGLIGTHGFKKANTAISKADLLIFIGTRLADRTTAGSAYFAKDADIIHIDIDPAEIGKNLDAILPVVGDAKDILLQLISGFDAPMDTKAWLETINGFENKILPINKKDVSVSSNTVSPLYALKLLSHLMEEDSIIVTDVGQNQIWTARNFEMRGSMKFLTSGGLGTMGYGLPAAIGAKLGNPEKRVLLVAGDGGFQMSLFELGTIAQNDINLIILLFNNSRLGMVNEIQRKIYKEPFGVFLNVNPDFIKLAEAYGLYGIKVTSNDELEAAFNKAIHLNKTCIIECIVDSEEPTMN